MQLRRTTFKLAVVGAIAGSLLAGTAPFSTAAENTPTGPTLRKLAKPTGVRIGTAVDTAALVNDTTYRTVTAQQFDSVTPENVMKWEVVQPERSRYDFTEADKLVAYARANKQKVRGHTLVWHSQLPKWLTDGDWTKQELKSILREHVRTEVSHFRGKVWAWDVVNEAFNEDGSLRDSIFLRTLGPSYIADSFRWAHQADPKAILFYNDYNTEGRNAKSDAAYALIKQLKAEGVPIHGYGVQGHLSTDYDLPNDMEGNLRRFGQLGLRTAVTEADVRITLPASPAERLAQSAGYSYMLQSCLLNRSCISFTVWGFTDKYSWVPGTFPGEGSANIYTEEYEAKAAYGALRRDLQLAAGVRRSS